MIARIEMDDDIDLPRLYHAPHESFHPDQVPDIDNSVIKSVRATLQLARDTQEAIDQLRPMRSPLDTPATHSRKIARAVDNFDHEWGTMADRDREALSVEAKRLDGELDRVANLKANPRFEATICATFLAMKPENRIGEVQKLIEAGDTVTLATLIDAPVVVTGLPSEFKDKIREQVLRRVAPVWFAHRQAIDVASEKLNSASLCRLRIANELRVGTGKDEAAIAEADAFAKRAKAT